MTSLAAFTLWLGFCKTVTALAILGVALSIKTNSTGPSSGWKEQSLMRRGQCSLFDFKKKKPNTEWIG